MCSQYYIYIGCVCVRVVVGMCVWCMCWGVCKGVRAHVCVQG